MNVREDILKRAGILNEMAAKELQPVIDLIKSGDIDKAVSEYLDLGGNPKGVTRTVNNYLNKHPEVKDKSNFDSFQKVFSEINKKEGAKAPKREYKTKKTGVTKEGEVVQAGGQSARRRTSRMVEKGKKEIADIEATLERLDKMPDAELKTTAKEMVDDLKAGKVYKEDKPLIDTLEKFIETGEDKSKALRVMDQILNAGKIAVRDLAISAANPEKIKGKNLDWIKGVQAKIESKKKKLT